MTAGAVKARARELGFDLCGIARADSYPELAFYSTWIASGMAASMHYLERTAEQRADVRHVMPSTRSVIVLGTNYHTDRPYSTESQDARRALVARYAWGDDYHDVIAARLAQLVSWMRAQTPTAFEARAYVDTGPVQERVYAQYAGLGWIGKNTCLINLEQGSWLFLAEVLCSLDLEPDEPEYDHCGTCTECLKACPTGALVEPGVLDANRCLSYWTIEHRGPLPEPWQRAIGAHIYGCDICQEVCPWNVAPPLASDPAWQPRPVFDRVALATLSDLPDDTLRHALKGSPMRRAKLEGLRRNIAAAMRNSPPESDDA
ncbi:MAG: tRNA epoxyqueuosine(34) reductase QueG [Vicinamibacterales bacterium]